ncbi:TonB-dependent receptor [Pedobacter polaris]|uniref:TonB-dependent receptor n=1 Tax=Pedobacter polaris TaxID=2571273 RepID=A0A4U1CK48_9SPHI|nr:outer membrane beta-barrel protein [Pedobacter polaris]TKC08000.1 TonB-dependent receptor [Pedobacter polaris]
MLKKGFICCLLYVLIASAVRGQDRYSARIHVVDAFSQKDIANASVSILNSADSILVRYGWTSSDGTLAFNTMPKGNFIVMVNYPTYVDYVEHFVLDSIHKSLDLGVVKLSPTIKVLQEVVIKGTGSGLIINGDTLQYDAKSFVIEKNAKVEDLLRQIPGLQVDNFGRITAYGQKIGKVLVDGEEFFGDDPTLVTKNIRGDMVKTIQIYDKKSDQATFTGIDDGIKTKTINVTLKEDKKKGYFGQATASYGTKQYYQEQFMFNLFRDKSKFSVFGNLANTGKLGLSSSENDKYGINAVNNNLFLRGVLVSLRTSDEDLGTERYNGQGNPIARTAGVHYDSKWDKDRQSINTNFLIGSVSVEGLRNAISRNELPSAIQVTTSDQVFEKYSFRSKIDGTYFAKLDSASTLKISIDGTHKKNESGNTFSSITVGDGLAKLNVGQRSLNSVDEQNMFNASELYTKKFKTPRRTISLQLNQSANKSNTTGFLGAQNDFYTPQGNISKTEIVNQKKTWALKNEILGGNISYTEPLSKYLSLISSYGVGFANSTSTRISYNQSTTGVYDQVDFQYSNDYELNELSQKVEAVLSYNKGQETMRLGNELSDIRFSQLDLYTDVNYKRRFTNYIPSAIYIKNTDKKTFRLDYRGTPIQPTIDQIQPVKTNIDPLNIFTGNPDLFPSYRHSISLYYVLSKPLTKRNIVITAQFSLIKDPLINSFVTNTEGVTTYQSVNYTEGEGTNFNVEGTYSKLIKPLELNTLFSMGFSETNDYGLSNFMINKRKAQVYSARLNLFKYKLKKYNFSLNLRPSYAVSKATLSRQFDNSGFSFNGDASATINIFKSLAITTNGNYVYQAKTPAFKRDYSLFLINTTISKKFLEKENVKFSISVNDLLNQNNGFTRAAYGTVLTQTTYSTIKRYVMLSLMWDFSKFGTLKTN